MISFFKWMHAILSLSQGQRSQVVGEKEEARAEKANSDGNTSR
jgi:hypothetical protein